MKKYILISLLFGFALGYIVFIGLDEFSNANTVAKDSSHMNHDMTTHAHDNIEVQSALIPSLSLRVYSDVMSGYNIQLVTDNFNFTPELVNTENIENEGHAHLYINDEKVARVYGEWFHLDDHHLGDTMNMLRVSLNANDHSEWSINNNPIQASIILN